MASEGRDVVVNARAIVVIVRPEVLPAIRKRLAGDPDVLVFSASDSVGRVGNDSPTPAQDRGVGYSICGDGEAQPWWRT